ncbi:hypothetical protein Arcve_0560 [Archaeoglobus veneficus SNP6]|uniref:Transposase n=2 Tax=Archaeoglobus veneficus TaxID=58290 RepID=F2KQM2_ARCVS|nr:hypothetical protein Arcve_0560 [Archaeoglobus veneficus SNP6]
MQLQIQIPLQLTIDIQNKKIPIQELTSALRGIEAEILGKVLEEIDNLLINSMQKGYGKNDYHKQQKEKRTIVTQLGKTTFTLTSQEQIDRQNYLSFVLPCRIRRKKIIPA